MSLQKMTFEEAFEEGNMSFRMDKGFYKLYELIEDDKTTVSIGEEATVFVCKSKQQDYPAVAKVVMKRKGSLVGRMELPQMSLLREMYFLRKLNNHPHIVHAFGLFEEPNRFLLVLEYQKGYDMNYYLKGCRHRIPRLFDMAYIIRQLAEALAHCHKHYIVHGDVKFENIVFRQPDKPHDLKLIDFSESQEFLDKAEWPTAYLTRRRCTNQYASPEMIDENKFNEKTDIWSLGVVAHNLYHGAGTLFGADINYNRTNRNRLTKHLWSKKDGFNYLLDRTLRYNVNQRISAETVLGLTFIKSGYAKAMEYYSTRHVPDEDVQKQVAKNFGRNYKSVKNGEGIKKNEAFSQFVRSYICNHLIAAPVREKLSLCFATYDKSNDGMLQAEEMKNALREFLTADNFFEDDISDETLSQVFKAADKDGDNEVSFEEFLEAACANRMLMKSPNLELVFRAFDRDRDGSISREELEAAMIREGYSTTGIDNMLQDVDKDGNGQISRDEFMSLFREV